MKAYQACLIWLPNWSPCAEVNIALLQDCTPCFKLQSQCLEQCSTASSWTALLLLPLPPLLLLWRLLDSTFSSLMRPVPLRSQHIGDANHVRLHERKKLLTTREQDGCTLSGVLALQKVCIITFKTSPQLTLVGH